MGFSLDKVTHRGQPSPHNPLEIASSDEKKVKVKTAVRQGGGRERNSVSGLTYFRVWGSQSYRLPFHT